LAVLSGNRGGAARQQSLRTPATSFVRFYWIRRANRP